MGDRFVDVRYRGLEVGRGLKLRDVSTDGAYLEAPLPMPVGSPIEIALDDGTRIAAIVALVHEQVGGSAVPPGMRVRPPARSEAWWREQPAPLPVVAATPPVVIDVSGPEPSGPVSVSPIDSAPVSAPVIVIEAAPPVDSGVIAVEIAPEASGDLSGDVSSSGELPAVDDDVSASGSHATVDDDVTSSGSHPAVGSNGQPKPGGRSKRKSGSRKKRNTR
jgi:hypothetical protein